MDETVVKLTDVWKVFGARSEEAMDAIKAEGLTKPEVLERFGCVVGVQAASFEVARGEIFCIMGLPPFKLSIRPITSAFGHTPQSIFEYVAVLV